MVNEIVIPILRAKKMMRVLDKAMTGGDIDNLIIPEYNYLNKKIEEAIHG